MTPSRTMTTLLALQKYRRTVFFEAPLEILVGINEYVYANPEIQKALNHAAYARAEDVAALLDMLEQNPNLLLQEGYAQTPGGDEVTNVTLYEFILGAGDYDLANNVQGYFSRIDNGEQEMRRQYERYRPHIEGMMTQEPDNLECLIELIKQATPEEISALLNNEEMPYDSELCQAMEQFRRDRAPKVLDKPCMHYNYQSPIHAFQLLNREWDNLVNGNNYDKVDLVWRVIGFELRRSPGIGRCMMAQGLQSVIDRKEPVERSYKFAYGGGDFQDCRTDDSHTGLGFHFGLDVYWGGWRAVGWGGGGQRACCGAARDGLYQFMSNNYIKLAGLMHPQPAHQQSRCVLM